MSEGAATIKGWHVLAALLVFFGAVIAINAAFIIAAVDTFPGEDVRRSYLQGLNYNETLGDRRAQAALGWRAGTELRQGAHGAELVVLLRTRDGRALDGLTVTGDLGRRTSAQLDRALSFRSQGGGVYVADVSGLAPGQWRLRGRASSAEGAVLDFESDLAWTSR